MVRKEDFTYTIEDDESQQIETATKANSNKKKGKANKKSKEVAKKKVKLTKDNMNPDFVFEYEGLGNQPSWLLNDSKAQVSDTDSDSDSDEDEAPPRQPANKGTKPAQQQKAKPTDDESDASDTDNSADESQSESETTTSEQGSELRVMKMDTMSDAEDDGRDTQESYDKDFFAAASSISDDTEVTGKQGSTDKTFADLNLSRPLLKAVTAMGYEHPTPIQDKAIPLLLNGQDLCGSAQTGSGKTAAFMLPILERLLYRPRRVAAIRVLVLLPTRELADQCFDVAQKLAQFTDIRCCLILGGVPPKTQEAALRERPDVVIGTPGRIIDHLLNTSAFGLDDLEILVLDEADRLLELGFKDELAEIVKHCPMNRQTMLFSATMTDEVEKLASLSLKHPARIAIDHRENVSSTLVQEFVRIRERREHEREPTLLALCEKTYKHATIIFCNLKVTVHRIKTLFYLLGFNAAALHGNLSQEERLGALSAFRNKKVDYLICTDVAARGLDIHGVEAVINYDMPQLLTTYIHRVGRTARAGREGRSCSLTGEESRQLLRKIMRRANKNKEQVHHRIVDSELVHKWENKIASIKGRIEDQVQKEALEKEMRKAEMEITKAENIAKYKKEIMSRPARTWFQSTAEKEETKKRAREELDAKTKDKRNAKRAKTGHEESKASKEKGSKLKKLSKRKQRSHRLTEEVKEARGIRNLDEFRRAGARSVKRAERAQRSGLLSKKDAEILKGGGKKDKKNKKEKKSAGDMFSSDFSSKSASSASTSASAGKKRKPERKGAFKSKAKYKRR